MDRKTLSILLGVALIASFFLPFLQNNGRSVSMMDMVKMSAGGATKYLVLLIPISGLMLMIDGLKKGTYHLGRSLWAWLPLLTLLFILIIEPMINGMQAKQVFNMLGKGYGIGLWIAIVASVVAAFSNQRAG